MSIAFIRLACKKRNKNNGSTEIIIEIQRSFVPVTEMLVIVSGNNFYLLLSPDELMDNFDKNFKTCQKLIH